LKRNDGGRGLKERRRGRTQKLEKKKKKKKKKKKENCAPPSWNSAAREAVAAFVTQKRSSRFK